MSVSKETLNKIKSENIQQKSEIQIVLEHALKILFIIVLILLATVFSTIVFDSIINLDLPVFLNSRADPFSYITSNIPLIIVVLTFLLVLLSIYSIRNTENGYRYNLVIISLGISLFLFITGLLLANTGIGKKVFNHQNHNVFVNEWHAPKQGLLIGRVYKIIDHNHFVLIDQNNHRWIIRINNSTNINFNQLLIEDIVRIQGKVIVDNLFKADVIRILEDSRVIEYFIFPI